MTCLLTSFAVFAGILPGQPDYTLARRTVYLVVPFFRRFRRMLKLVIYQRCFKGDMSKANRIKAYLAHIEDVGIPAKASRL